MRSARINGRKFCSIPKSKATTTTASNEQTEKLVLLRESSCSWSLAGWRFSFRTKDLGNKLESPIEKDLSKKPVTWVEESRWSLEIIARLFMATLPQWAVWDVRCALCAVCSTCHKLGQRTEMQPKNKWTLRAYVCKWTINATDGHALRPSQ